MLLATLRIVELHRRLGGTCYPYIQDML